MSGDSSGSWWQRVDPRVAAEWAVVGLVVVFYAALKTYAMWLRPGDEHIYFAMARAVADGAVPYRDFFFAHPPVHILVPALVFKVVGFSYGVAFWIAPAACLAAGLALWRLVRRFAPPWSAVLAMVLFLFGRTVLQSSAHLTGVNIAMAFLLWGAERTAADRPRTGGALLALSVLSGLYVLPAALGVIACHWLMRPRSARRSAVTFALVGLGMFALFDILTRGALLEQVVWYHKAKAGGMGAGWPTFAKTKGAELFHNWPLFLGTIVGGIASLAALAFAGRAVRAGGADSGVARSRRGGAPGRGRPAASGVPSGGDLFAALGSALGEPAPEVSDVPRLRSPAAAVAGVWGWLGAVRGRVVAGIERAPWAALGVVGLFWVAGHWVFLSTLAVVWRYYYAVVFAGASVATAMVAVAVWRGLGPLPALIRARAKGPSWAPVAFAAVVLGAFGLLLRYDLALGAKYDIWGEDKASAGKASQCSDPSCALGCTNDGYVGGSCDSRKGCVCRYGWAGSPAGWVPGWFNSAVKAVWWGGDTIPDGRRYWSIENTLWHESRGAPVEPRYLAAARAISDLACPGDTIFGDSGVAPMLANLTGLRVAGLVFDTNQQRFATGYIDRAETVGQIEADGVRFVVLGWGGRDASGRDTFKNSWAKDGPIAEFVEGGFDRVWPGRDDAPFDVVVLGRRGAPDCGQ